MKKILIIDDDQELAQELAEALSEAGCYAACENNGQRGLERIIAEPWDAIVLDFKMPGLNGIDLLMQCKEHQAALAVILITGSLDIQARLEQAGLEGMVARVLTKPFDFEELMGEISKLPG
jgi:DNA-binding response OmpR family regulator